MYVKIHIYINFSIYHRWTEIGDQECYWIKSITVFKSKRTGWCDWWKPRGRSAEVSICARHISIMKLAVLLIYKIKTASFVRGQASGFWLGSGWFTTRLKPSSFFTLGESRVTRRLLFRSILSTELLEQATGWIKNQIKEDSSLQNRGDFLFYCVFQACRGKCASRATR